VDWNVLDAKGQYEVLTRHNIPVWVMEPLKGGRLATLNEAACGILKEAAPERSIPSWGFRWLMGLPNVRTVLSGMGNISMVEDNCATFHEHKPLTVTETEVLETARAAFIDDLGVPCSGCRYCCDNCPEQLNIPLLIQAYNEKRISGKTWRVNGLEGTKGAEHCIGCGACMEHCPQKIRIPDVMEALKKEN
jgi:predicted aldo/keto reductase-like oxidoreductase